MGFIPRDSWLPRLRDGTNVGARPASLQDRYAVLYKKFADSWRVTNKTSLFTYTRGTSTETFTDPDWPAERPPCKLKPEFQTGAPIHEGMDVEKAKLICRGLTDADLHANCVFDVATTGDEIFAEGYRFEQELRLYGTFVQIASHGLLNPSRSQAPTRGEQKLRPGRMLGVMVKVGALTEGRPIPTGCVTFFLDGVPMNRPVELDDRGRARMMIGPMEPGNHIIRATYAGGGKYDYHSSSSRNLLHKVARDREEDPKACASQMPNGAADAGRH